MKFISELGSSPEDQETMRKAVFGVGYKVDRDGNPIEQSAIDAAYIQRFPDRAQQHIDAIRRYGANGDGLGTPDEKREAGDNELSRLRGLCSDAGLPCPLK